LSSCDEIFVQTCLDQNFTHKGKGLLAYALVGKASKIKSNLPVKKTPKTKKKHVFSLDPWNMFEIRSLSSKNVIAVERTRGFV
jgi:hypothetical protein